MFPISLNTKSRVFKIKRKEVNIGSRISLGIASANLGRIQRHPDGNFVSMGIPIAFSLPFVCDRAFIYEFCLAFAKAPSGWTQTVVESGGDEIVPEGEEEIWKEETGVKLHSVHMFY